MSKNLFVGKITGSQTKGLQQDIGQCYNLKVVESRNDIRLRNNK